MELKTKEIIGAVVLAFLLILAIWQLVTLEDKPIEARLEERTHTITHEGCEYVVWTSYRAGGITHKANCKNH